MDERAAPEAERLRVGLLMYGVNRQLSGITRVTIELGRALQRSGSCDVVFLTPYRSGPFRDMGHESAYLPGCSRLPAMMAIGGPMIELAARRHRLDIIHDPTGISPFAYGGRGRWPRRVVTIHDAIAFRFPQGYPWLNNFLHRRWVPRTLANVDAVMTVSHNAGQDLERYLHVDPSRLHVVPAGVGDQFRRLPPDTALEVAARYGLRQPYVLHVGIPAPRKNVVRLVEAFAGLHERLPEYRLVLVGRSAKHMPEVAAAVDRLGLADSVSLIGHVRDDDLPAIYGAASLFVLPSLYEGFGLPLLEAMACGTPIACADATSLPEVAGDAAVLFDPLDVPAMTAAMARVLTEPQLAQTLSRRGLERVRDYSWERTAEKTIDVYRQVMREPSPAVNRPRWTSADGGAER